MLGYIEVLVAVDSIGLHGGMLHYMVGSVELHGGVLGYMVGVLGYMVGVLSWMEESVG